jgi:hypothetical protein
MDGGKMSVINKTHEEITSIAQRLRRLAASDPEITNIMRDFSDKPFNGFNPEIFDKIDWLMGRLYAGNQLAYHFTYSFRDGNKHIELNFPPENEHEIITFDPMDIEQLYHLREDLSSLDYNCISNAGRYFISGDDEQKLDKLKNHLPRRPEINMYEGD